MDGAKVAFCDVDVVKGNLLSKQTNARFFEADVKNEELWNIPCAFYSMSGATLT
jgi:hypothetical protein